MTGKPLSEYCPYFLGRETTLPWSTEKTSDTAVSFESAYLTKIPPVGAYFEFGFVDLLLTPKTSN